jgi:hypothetical protein
MTNEDRLAHHLTSEFDARLLGSFDLDGLQAFLDRKSQTLSFSVVDHVRWDLKQIFDMAVAEGYLQRTPAALLFTPRECRRAAREWARMEADYADIRQRVYRGDVDSPKSARSVRFAALSDGLLASIDKCCSIPAPMRGFSHRWRGRLGLNGPIGLPLFWMCISIDYGAGDGDRTRDVQLGKLAFYR